MNDNRKNIAHHLLEKELLTTKLKAVEAELVSLRTQNKTYKDLLDMAMKEIDKIKAMK